jgi:hypothetical protein
MRLKHSTRFMKGFKPIVEAVEGHYLFGGRTVHDGQVFERFCDALYVMNEWIKSNQQTGCPVKVGRVEPFEGMVSVLSREDLSTTSEK